jgi:hypothetical protein
VTDPDRLRLAELGFDGPMSPRQRQALLQAYYPTYEIWYVPRALGGMIWCARRDPKDTHPITADKPSELAKAIDAEQREEGDDGDNSGGSAGPDQSPASGVDDNEG